MAFSHGRNCELAVDEFDITELFRSMTFNADVDTADTSVFRQDWKTFIPGMAASTVTLDGLYDEAREDEIRDRIAIATPFVATVGPAGLAVGDLVRMLEVNSTNMTESASVGDAVMLSWALQTTGEVSFGRSLSAPTVEVTADGNGAAVDQGAAITGALWVAHFHLFNLDATNVTLTVQDSADGSTDWQPITSATSGSLTAVDVVRVTGTGTVRRYVRASWDVNGGNTSATFNVSFSRKAA